MTLGQLRLDNCLLDASNPTALCSPVTYSLFGTPQPISPQAGWWAEEQGQPADWRVAGAAGTAARSASIGRRGALGLPRSTAGDATPRRSLTGANSGALVPSRGGGFDALDGAAWPAGFGGDSAAAGGDGAGGKLPEGGSLTVNTCVWLNRPGGVLCVQHASVSLAPLALNIEETHVRTLISYALDMVALRKEALRDGQASTLGAEAAADAWAAAAAAAGGPDASAAAGADAAGDLAGRAAGVAAAPRGSGGARDIVLDTSGDVHVVEVLDVGLNHQPRLAPAVGALARPSRAHMPWEPQTRMLADPNLLSVVQRPKVYLDSMAIARLRLSLSFLPAPWRSLPSAALASAAPAPRARWQTAALSGPAGAAGAADASTRGPRLDGRGGGGGGAAAAAARSLAARGGAPSGGVTSNSMMRLLLSLAHLEGAWLTLKPLHLRHPLVGLDDLGQLLARHYMAAALLQLALALGSLDIFGDVTRLVQAWGLGFWQIFVMPAQGAMQVRWLRKYTHTHTHTHTHSDAKTATQNWLLQLEGKTYRCSRAVMCVCVCVHAGWCEPCSPWCDPWCPWPSTQHHFRCIQHPSQVRAPHTQHPPRALPSRNLRRARRGRRPDDPTRAAGIADLPGRRRAGRAQRAAFARSVDGCGVCGRCAGL